MPRVLAGHRDAMSQLLPTLPVPREADMQPLWRFGGESDASAGAVLSPWHPTTAESPAGLADRQLEAVLRPICERHAASTKDELVATCVQAYMRMIFLADDPDPGSYNESALSAGEGVATVTPSSGSPYELYRGAGSIPLAELVQGWTHIGDPDSANGYIIDAYQGSSSGNKKMFLLTTPSGATHQYVHTLASGELYNNSFDNSFDAISPSTQWMVAGEWGTMTHLQVYPAPYFNSATNPGGGTLSLSGYINLSMPVSDIQGCDFVTATELICASDDSSDSIFANPFPLLEVTLAAPLNGGTVTGTVTDLGSIPQSSICSGTFEPEGVDYDPAAGVLRVEITQPGVCEVATTVYEYKQG
jgi:hypothetical protein